MISLFPKHVFDKQIFKGITPFFKISSRYFCKLKTVVCFVSPRPISPWPPRFLTRIIKSRISAFPEKVLSYPDLLVLVIFRVCYDNPKSTGSWGSRAIKSAMLLTIVLGCRHWVFRNLTPETSIQLGKDRVFFAHTVKLPQALKNLFVGHPGEGLNHFDNIIAALITAFEMISLEGWTGVMH